MYPLRALPSCVEIEKAVIGALIFDSSMVAEVATVIDRDDFWKREHRHLFALLVQMVASPGVVDDVTVPMRTLGAVSLYGTPGQVASLVSERAIPQSLMGYALQIRKASRARAMIAVLDEVSEASRAVNADLDLLTDGVMHRLGELASVTSTDTPELAGDLVDEQLEHMRYLAETGAAPRVCTGILTIDRLLGGGLSIEAPLYVLAARPGAGKSALALNIADHVAANVGPVGFISMEMGPRMVAQRLVTARASVPLPAVIEPLQLAAREWDRLDDARSSSPLLFNFSDRHMAAIRRTCLRWQIRHGKLRLLVIDHLLQFPMRSGSEISELGENTRVARELAFELGCPLLLLHQAGRRTDENEPRMSDLYGSSKIEHHADAVLFLYEQESDRTVVAVKAAKNRTGPVGRVAFVRFDGAKQRFKDTSDMKAAK